MTITLAFSPLHPEDLALDGLNPVSWGHARGTLHDDDGFPACVYGGDGLVRGHLHALAEDRRDAILSALDLQHGGADGPHRRTIVRLVDGGPLAWAWHWTGRSDLPPVPSGDWTLHSDPRLL